MEEVRGFDPVEEDLEKILKGMKNLGFQATELWKAGEIWLRMLEDNSTIFLAFTSNIISSGLREVIAAIIKHGMADVVITTVGSIEEDIMKSMKPFLLGDWREDDRELHRKEINRIGNILVPSDRYVALEEYVQPRLEEMYREKKTWSVKELVERLAGDIEDKGSFLYWALRKNVPVFCPAPTDGALGVQLYFFKQKHPEFVLDITGDMDDLAKIVLGAEKTGAVVIGGGIPKHHTIGVNLLRGGLDYALYITTAVEWDGSLSGAPPREAVSWGKISEEGRYTTVHAEATLVLPFLVHRVGRKALERGLIHK